MERRPYQGPESFQITNRISGGDTCRVALIRRLLVTISLFVAAAGSLWAAFTPISLEITFANAANGVGMTGDGDPYIHKEEGKVPIATINRDSLVLDTRGSTRAACILPDDDPATPGPAVQLAPMPGCYPVLLRTLIRPDNQRVADVLLGDSLDFGMDVYWTGPAISGGSFDYVLEYKRADPFGFGVTVSHPEPNIWTVENMENSNDYGQISVYRKGRNGGWSVVGVYAMPVYFTAIQQ